MSAAPPVAEWVETITVLAVGTGLIVGVAVLAAAWFRSAAAGRAVWQAATLGVLALVGCELCGAGAAAVSVVGCWLRGDDLVAGLPDAPGSGLGRFAMLPSFADPSGEPSIVERATREVARLDSAADAEHERTAAEPAGAASQIDALLEDLAALESELAVAEARILEQRASLADSPPAASRASPDAGTWWPGAVWLWGTILLFGWWAVHAAVWRMRLRGRRVPEDSPLAVRARRVADRLGYRRRFRLLEIEGLAGPVAFGVWRPTIGLPPTFGREFDAAQQEAMLAHEAAHLAGRDPLWQALAGTACALLWWQPLVWWQRRQLQSANEAAADEASLVVADGPSVLADCLVRLGRRLARARAAGPIGIEGGGFRSGLGRRVVRLLNLPRGVWRPERAARAAAIKTLATAALLAVVLLTTAWARRPAPSGEMDMSTFGNSWRKSLGAAALLAAWGPAGAAPAQEGQPDQAVVVQEDADRAAQPPVEVLLDRIKILEAELTAARHEARALIDASEAQHREAEAQQALAEESLRLAQRKRQADENDELQRARAELAEHIGALEKQYAAAREQGNKEEAQKLEEQLRAMREKMAAAQASGDEKAALKERLAQAEREIEALRAAGRTEEADALAEKVQAYIKSQVGEGEEVKRRQHDVDEAALKEKLAVAEREIEALRAAGRTEEADALARKVKESLQAHAAEGDEVKRRKLDEGERERAAAEEKLTRAKAEIQKLREEGRVEEAQALERRLQESLAERKRDEEKRDDEQRDEEKRPDAVQEEMARLKKLIGGLLERGDKEAAERLMRRMEELAAAQQPDRPRDESPERAELRRRLHHLTAAAENLQAAGMPDLAGQIHAAMEKINRELGDGGGRDRADRPEGGDRVRSRQEGGDDRARSRPWGQGGEAPPGDGRGFGGMRGFGGLDAQERLAAERELIDVVRSLRGEIQELREQMNDLRERVGHEDDEEEDDDADEEEEEGDGEEADEAAEEEERDAEEEGDDAQEEEGESDEAAEAEEGDDEEEGDDGEEASEEADEGEAEEEDSADEASDDAEGEESGEEADDSDEPSDEAAAEEAAFFRFFGGGGEQGQDESASAATTSDGSVPVPVP